MENVLNIKSIRVIAMRKIIKATVLSILLTESLSGCVTNPSTYIDQAIQSQAPQLIIASKPVGTGYYALLEKTGGRWQVISIDSRSIYSRDNDQQEILFVHHGLRNIAPGFDPRMYTTGEGAECTPLAQMRERNRYWLCNSYFSSIRIGMSVGRNIVSCALTFCLAAGTKEELDRDRIQHVVIESDLINLVKKQIAEDDHRAYWAAFNNAMKCRSVSQIEEFISRYRSDDPDKLIPQALSRIQDLKQSQALFFPSSTS